MSVWPRDARRPPYPLLLAGGMFLAFVLTFAFRWLLLSSFTNDHFDHVARGYQVLLGDWPVHDFVDPGLPLTYLLSAASHLLIRQPFLAEALVFVPAFALAAALSVRLAALASGSIVVALAAGALQVAALPRTYSYPKLLVYAVALTAGWWAIDRLTTRRLAVLAGVTAAAYYLRHDHGIYVAAGTLVLLTVHLRPGGLRPLLRTIGLYGALTFALVLPHLVYVEWAEGIWHYFGVARAYSAEEARTTRLPLPRLHIDATEPFWSPAPARLNVRWTPGLAPATRTRLERTYGLQPVGNDGGDIWSYDVAGGGTADRRAALGRDTHVAAVADFQLLSTGQRVRNALLGWFRPGPAWRLADNSGALLFWLCWLMPLAGIAALSRPHALAPAALANPHAKLAMLVTLAVCANLGFIRSPLLARLPDAAMPHTVLGAWLFAIAWKPSATSGGRAMRLACVGAALALAAVVFTAFGTGQQLLQSRLLAGPRATITRWRQVTDGLTKVLDGPVPGGPVRALAPFLRYVGACTAPGDRLLYVGYAPEIYVVADRGFAGGHMMFSTQFHADREEQALTLSRLHRQAVPFVIVPEASRASFVAAFGDIWRDLDQRYRVMTTVDDGGRVDILIDTSREAHGSYERTGWPCLSPQQPAEP